MSKFFEEFKKFITRGNVIDMAVGVIVGSAFTAIVNALGNNILKPVVNWLLSLVFGANSLSEVYTFLKEAYTETANEAGVVTRTLDLANSIYIDWGAFINAIINFFITAFVLFCIVKGFNKLREGGDKAEKAALNGVTKEEAKDMKAKGLNFRSDEDVKKYLADKAKAEAEAKAAAEEKARKEREANPTTEDLLKEILAIMKK